MAEEEEAISMREREERKGILSKLFNGEGRIRNFLQEGEIVIPEKPGPRIIGRDPVIGSLRRSMGLPVLRDEVPTLIEIEK